jgi:calcineurin-like phosphoesterase family protein
MKNRSTSVKQKNRKKEAYVFIRRLYKVLREQDERVILKKLHGRDGYYDPSTEEIVIDYRKEFISTLIHEVLHHLHPPWSESKVIMKEREIMNTITIRQCKNIIVMLARYL